jgi:hypothetical protein
MACSQIIQLSQAKVATSTIVNYIQNSGSIYGLNAPDRLFEAAGRFRCRHHHHAEPAPAVTQSGPGRAAAPA